MSASRRRSPPPRRSVLGLVGLGLALAGCIEAFPPGRATDTGPTFDAFPGAADADPRTPPVADLGRPEPRADRGAPPDPPPDLGPPTDAEVVARPDALAPVSDRDGDGSPDDVDCQPDDERIRPGIGETCNGQDDDCDGRIDEDFAPEPCALGGDAGRCPGVGVLVCQQGERVCLGTPPEDCEEDPPEDPLARLECPPGTQGSADGQSCMWRGVGGWWWDYAGTGCLAVEVAGARGRLATLETEPQIELARSLVAGRDPHWVGARRRGDDRREWVWSLGAPLARNGPLWAPGEPNDGGPGGRESCAELRPDGRLNDTSCYDLRPPLCEVEIVRVP